MISIGKEFKKQYRLFLGFFNISTMRNKVKPVCQKLSIIYFIICVYRVEII